jgi:DNA repair REX1-B
MSRQNQSGIDIRQALEILAARGSDGEKKSNVDSTATGHHHDAEHDCCGCQNSPFSAQALQNNATMGQVIDILGDDKGAEDDSAFSSTAAAVATLEEEKEMMEKRRQHRQTEMHEQLQTMTLQELLHTVLQAQEERVATYRRYDDGLQRVLQTNGNITQYPTVVAEATASFAVLSDTIRSVRQVLLLDNTTTTTTATTDATTASEKEEVAQLLSRLQMEEQNKLHLTAALHLETIRISSAAYSATVSGDSAMATTAANGGGGDDQDETAAITATTNSDADASAADKINRLYRESIASLQTKIGATVQEINEVLDEIRCIMME